MHIFLAFTLSMSGEWKVRSITHGTAGFEDSQATQNIRLNSLISCFVLRLQYLLGLINT